MDDDEDDARQSPRPPPPFNMPGYEWDGKRFYKKGTAAVPKQTTSRAAAARPQHSTTDEGYISRHARSRLRLDGVDRGLTWPSLENWLLSSPTNSTVHHRHCMQSLALARLSLTEQIEPDGLALGEDVTCINFDADLNTIRAGGSFGAISTGFVTRPDDAHGWFPNDRHAFRTTFMLPNKVTSLSTSQGYLLATSFGSPARAVFSSTSEDVSLGSIVLSPGKTSIWSAAQAGRSIALGCDRGVMVTRDPTLPHMSTFVTGGKGGGGNVFALDMTENLVFAGTRKGHVRVFDQRCGPETTKNGLAKAQLTMHVNAPVTHCKRVQEGVLVATMNGTLALHDLRSFKTGQTLVNCSDHVNSITTDLGMDVWRDEYVAMAGEDGRVRIWSLLNGKQLTAPDPTSNLSFDVNLLSKQFEQPVKALAFTGSLDVAAGSIRSDDGHHHQELERFDGVYGRFKGPTLWLATGPSMERFDLGGSST
ncbi:hypothetical protein ACM66B_005418 [Microbotryomycetes sp. NB124-2]